MMRAIKSKVMSSFAHSLIIAINNSTANNPMKKAEYARNLGTNYFPRKK